MKTVLISVVACLLLAGCGPEFGLGFGSGAAVMAKMAEDSQSGFIAAVDNIDARATELNTLAGTYSTNGLIKPETLAALDKAKGFKNNPVAWVAIAEALAIAFGAGVLKKKKSP